jgi:hypothetical protein
VLPPHASTPHPLYIFWSPISAAGTDIADDEYPEEGADMDED